MKFYLKSIKKKKFYKGEMQVEELLKEEKNLKMYYGHHFKKEAIIKNKLNKCKAYLRQSSILRKK